MEWWWIFSIWICRSALTVGGWGPFENSMQIHAEKERLKGKSGFIMETNTHTHRTQVIMYAQARTCFTLDPFSRPGLLWRFLGIIHLGHDTIRMTMVQITVTLAKDGFWRWNMNFCLLDELHCTKLLVPEEHFSIGNLLSSSSLRNSQEPFEEFTKFKEAFTDWQRNHTKVWWTGKMPAKCLIGPVRRSKARSLGFSLALSQSHTSKLKVRQIAAQSFILSRHSGE